MADGRGAAAVCDDRCGCPTPCTGGMACRCTTVASGLGEAAPAHRTCSCGEHCGCNPCTCENSDFTGTAAGKAFCKCGAGCTCATCTS